MAPTSRIYLTRHAQAEHAERLARRTPALQANVQLVLSSPLRRTLQTTSAGFAPAIERLGGHAKVVCLPQLQEFAKWNLELLTPDWTGKQGFYAATDEALAARAQWVRQYLRSCEEEHIAVVAHGDFLRQLTGEDVVGLFTFDEHHVKTDACPLRFVEIVESGGWLGEDDHDDAPPATGAPQLNAMSQSNDSALDANDIVHARQASLASQTDELQALERRLAEAEQREVEVRRASHTA